jgi:hypothetical protein
VIQKAYDEAKTWYITKFVQIIAFKTVKIGKMLFFSISFSVFPKGGPYWNLPLGNLS